MCDLIGAPKNASDVCLCVCVRICKWIGSPALLRHCVVGISLKIYFLTRRLALFLEILYVSQRRILFNLVMVTLSVTCFRYTSYYTATLQ